MLYLFFLLVSFTCFPQKKMVKIEGLQTVNVMDFHEVAVDDSLSFQAVKKFVGYMERNPIDYEDAIRKVTMVRTIQADRYFIGELDKGIISLNSRLNAFPYTKQVVILTLLAENNGAKMAWFPVTDAIEKRHERRIKTNSIYTEIVRKLIIANPLRAKK